MPRLSGEFTNPQGAAQMFPPEAGQMIVEYVLLLLVAISLAMILRTALVKGGDDPSSSGAVLQRWQETAVGIGADDPNDRTK